jgi:hypothetical protein
VKDFSRERRERHEKRREGMERGFSPKEPIRADKEKKNSPRENIRHGGRTEIF